MGRAGSTSADVALLRVQNPRALLIPELNALVLRALSTSPLTLDAEAAVLELVDYVAHPQLGLYVARENGRYVGLALCENNTSALSPGCMVLHFYNRGSAEARKALLEGIASFARDGGNWKIWGFDVNSKPRAFARLFASLGAPQARGQLFEFDVTEGEM